MYLRNGLSGYHRLMVLCTAALHTFAKWSTGAGIRLVTTKTVMTQQALRTHAITSASTPVHTHRRLC